MTRAERIERALREIAEWERTTCDETTCVVARAFQEIARLALAPEPETSQPAPAGGTGEREAAFEAACLRTGHVATGAANRIAELEAEKGGLVSTIEGLRHDIENAERRGWSACREAAAKAVRGLITINTPVSRGDAFMVASETIRALTPPADAKTKEEP